MELLSMLSAFCVALSLLLAQSESVQLNLPESPEHGNHPVLRDKFTMLPLSRKLKLNGETNAFADKDLVPEKFYKPASGEKLHKEGKNVMKHEASKEAKETERIGAANYRSSEDFTMDYHGVRRRRPIHNKNVPYIP